MWCRPDVAETWSLAVTPAFGAITVLPALLTAFSADLQCGVVRRGLWLVALLIPAFERGAVSGDSSWSVYPWPPRSWRVWRHHSGSATGSTIARERAGFAAGGVAKRPPDRDGYRRGGPPEPTRLRPGHQHELVELADRGIRFDSARAASSWTLPSHAKMFTGRWHTSSRSVRLRRSIEHIPRWRSSSATEATRRLDSSPIHRIVRSIRGWPAASLITRTTSSPG